MNFSYTIEIENCLLKVTDLAANSFYFNKVDSFDDKEAHLSNGLQKFRVHKTQVLNIPDFVPFFTSYNNTCGEANLDTPLLRNVVDLICVFGESNSSGRGANNDVRSDLLLIDNDVQVWNPNDLEFQPLEIGVNNIFNSVPSVDWTKLHGVELTIKNEYRNYFHSKQIFIVKGGQGSSTISQWQSGGLYYSTELITKRLLPAIAELKSRNYEVRVTAWFMQGVNDYIAGTPLLTWETQVKNLFNNLKTDIPGINIIMTELPNAVHSGFDAKVAEIASEEDNVYYVKKPTNPLRDPNHWSYLGLRSLARRLMYQTTSIYNNLGGLNYTENSNTIYLSGVTGAALIETDLDISVDSSDRIFLTFELVCYNHNTNRNTTLTISCYVNEVSPISSIATYTSSNKLLDLPINIGVKSGKVVLVAGTIGTAWLYSTLKYKAIAAHKNTTVEVTEKLNKCNISVITSLTDITSLVTPTLNDPTILNNGQGGNSNSTIINYPSGGRFKTATPSTTGYIKIKLPARNLNSMIKIEGYVYDHKADGKSSFDFNVSGYDSSAGFVNPSAFITSAVNLSYPIRLYDTGTEKYILIGTSTTVWNYPDIVISRVTVSHSNATSTVWGSGWVISLLTTAPTGTLIYENKGTNASGSFTRLYNSGAASEKMITLNALDGSYKSVSPSITGSVKIKVPTYQSSMIAFTVRIYNYSSESYYELKIGAYFATSVVNNITVWGFGISGVNYPVKIYRDAATTNVVVEIGTAATVWNYPMISLGTVDVGHQGGSDIRYQSGWTITLDTSTPVGTEVYSKTTTNIIP